MWAHGHQGPQPLGLSRMEDGTQLGLCASERERVCVLARGGGGGCVLCLGLCVQRLAGQAGWEMMQSDTGIPPASSPQAPGRSASFLQTWAHAASAAHVQNGGDKSPSGHRATIEDSVSPVGEQPELGTQACAH